MRDLPETPPVFTTAQWLLAGGTTRGLRTAVSRNTVRRLSTGIYERSDRSADEEDPEDWAARRRGYLDRVAAASARIGPGHVVSHLSAAAAYDLPMPMGDLGRPQLTAVTAYQRSRDAPSARLHHCDSTLTAVDEVDGLTCTSLTRTLADVLRSHGPRVAVPIVDAALGSRRTTIERVEAELATQVRWRGRPRALASLLLVDGRRESWLESWSAVWLHQHGFPLGEPQVSVFDEDGDFVARVDQLWPSGLVGEADGRAKYTTLTTTPDDTVYREKLRADGIRSAGLPVERWGLTHLLEQPDRLVARLRRADARAREEVRFRGFIRLASATGLTKVSKWDPADPRFRHLR